MLKSFALLVALSLADGVLTAAEAAHVGSVDIEANPVLLAVLHTAGVPGMFAFKVVPLVVFGALLLLYRPLPRVTLALVGVYSGVMLYHAILLRGAL
jgi:hypothetical protein